MHFSLHKTIEYNSLLFAIVFCGMLGNMFVGKFISVHQHNKKF